MDRLHYWYRPDQTIGNGAMTSNRKTGRVVRAAGDKFGNNIEVNGDFQLILTM